MNGNRKMSFRVFRGMPLLAQIGEGAAKAFEDEFGESPKVCEVPQRLARKLPARIGTMTVRPFNPHRGSPSNEYWVGVE